MLRSPLVIGTLVPLLTACVAAGSSGVTVQTAVVACPHVKDYPPAVQARAADELEALPPDATLRGLVVDYGELREAARACDAMTP